MNPNEPSGLARQVADGSYRGLWIILRDWFRVPEHPPSLPMTAGGTVSSFRPAEGYLRYMKLEFWIFVLALDGAILAGWIALAVAMPVVGLMLLLPAIALALLPDLLAYIGLRLRFDTTWYVMSDRSIRIRRGIWIIEEVTITFENVQNVSVAQGPLQRYFGIADVTIQTAGGGAAGPHGASMGGHMGIIEGIANADHMRDAILAKVKESRHAGLGDERHHEPRAATTGFSPAHVALLREIRDAARSAAATGA